MFKNYLLIAFRNLKRNRLYSIINLSGLAIGIAGCMLIALYVQDELSYDRFHEKGDRIYRVNSTYESPERSGEGSITCDPLSPTLKESIPEVEDYVRFTTNSFLVRAQDRAFTERIHFADPNFFEFFTFPLIHGQPEQVLKELKSLVITEDIARKFFGKTNVINQTLSLETEEGFESYVISGVAKNPPRNSSIRFGIVANFELAREKDKDTPWADHYINNFVLLEQGVEMETVNAKIPSVVDPYLEADKKTIKEKYNYESDSKDGFTLDPLYNIHLHAEVGGGNGVSDVNDPVQSYILSGIGLFILLIACINFTNLSLAQSLPRAKEIGLRKVIGATRQQISQQFLGEAFLLCLLATLMGVVLAELFLPVFNDLTGKELSIRYFSSLTTLGIGLSLLVISALLAGFYPARVLSKFEPVRALKGKMRLGRKQWFTKAMIVLQFAVSAFLIMVLLVLNRQMNYLEKKDLGYDDQNLIRVQTGWKKGDRILKLFKNDLKNEPSIVSVTGRSGGTRISSYEFDGQEQAVNLSKVDEQFLATLKIKLKSGRNFSPKFKSDSTRAAVVNQTLVDALKLENPIGTKVSSQWDEKLNLQIVGVIEDYHFDALHQEISPQLLYMLPSEQYSEIWVRIQPNQLAKAQNLLKETWRKYEPYRPYEAELVEIENRAQYEAEQDWLRIISISSVFAIFISLIGLFGLATLHITQRTKEIGIRKVLGATVRSLVWLLSNQFNRLVLIGIVMAIPLGYWAGNQWLQNFAYRTNIGWDIFLWAGLITLLTAFLAVIYQSIRIALGNPVDSLRYE